MKKKKNWLDIIFSDDNELAIPVILIVAIAILLAVFYIKSLL